MLLSSHSRSQGRVSCYGVVLFTCVTGQVTSFPLKQRGAVPGQHQLLVVAGAVAEPPPAWCQLPDMGSHSFLGVTARRAHRVHVSL